MLRSRSLGRLRVVNGLLLMAAEHGERAELLLAGRADQLRELHALGPPRPLCVGAPRERYEKSLAASLDGLGVGAGGLVGVKTRLTREIEVAGLAVEASLVLASLSDGSGTLEDDSHAIGLDSFELRGREGEVGSMQSLTEGKMRACRHPGDGVTVPEEKVGDVQVIRDHPDGGTEENGEDGFEDEDPGAQARHKSRAGKVGPTK